MTSGVQPLGRKVARATAGSLRFVTAPAGEGAIGKPTKGLFAWVGADAMHLGKSLLANALYRAPASAQRKILIDGLLAWYGAWAATGRGHIGRLSPNLACGVARRPVYPLLARVIPPA